MVTKEKEKFNIIVEDVVRWGECQEMGIVKEIRIIDTAKFVQRFSGNEDAVMLRIFTDVGAALIWPKEHDVFKVSDHDAKEFKSKLKAEGSQS